MIAFIDDHREAYGAVLRQAQDEGVNRQFKAPHPNALWVSDFTDVATWSGFVYVAFVIDAYARRIVGGRVSRTAHATFVLVLRQAQDEGAGTGPARTPSSSGRRARAP